MKQRKRGRPFTFDTKARGTTVMLPVALLRAAKIRAVETGCNFSAVMAAALTQYLKEGAK